MYCFLPFKSAPAQKARPVPVMIPQLKDGSLSSHSQIFSNSLLASLLRQFRSFGRLILASSTPCAGYARTTCLVAGSGTVNLGLNDMGAMAMVAAMQRVFEYSCGSSSVSGRKVAQSLKVHHLPCCGDLQTRTTASLGFQRLHLLLCFNVATSQEHDCGMIVIGGVRSEQVEGLAYLGRSFVVNPMPTMPPTRLDRKYA